MNPRFEKMLAHYETTPEQATEYGSQWLHLMLRCAEKAFLIRSSGYITATNKQRHRDKLKLLLSDVSELAETALSISLIDGSDELQFGTFKAVKPLSMTLTIKPDDGAREFVRFGEIETEPERRLIMVHPLITLSAPIPPKL